MADRPDVDAWRDASAASSMAGVSAAFRRFAEFECRGYCPFYERISSRVATDADLVALTLDRPSGQPAPNLLFGAVRRLLSSGADHPLRAHYERVARDPASAGGESEWAAFRSFCLDHRVEIAGIVRTHRVQTNEIVRTSGIRFGIASALSGRPPAPIALIEIGCSAGLLLALDRYACDYRTADGRTIRTGPADAAVRLECEVRGRAPAELGSPFPRVVSRVGIDLHPIDVRDPDALRWLQALIWPDRPDRERRLVAAAAALCAVDVDLRTGDASDLLAAAIDDAPKDADVCVFQSSFWHQVPSTARERIDEAIREASRRRPIVRVSCDSHDGHVNELRTGLLRERLVAHVHPHGTWLEPTLG